MSRASLAGGAGPGEGGCLPLDHLQLHLEVEEVRDQVSDQDYDLSYEGCWLALWDSCGIVEQRM